VEQMGGHQVVPHNLSSNIIFSYLGSKEIWVPNSILVFLKIFFFFKRGNMNLMFKIKLKKPFDSFLLEEGRTGQPHNFFY
jgi:hypothetical protein